MRTFVVDTNVAVTANGGSEQAGHDCVQRCISMLGEVQRGGKLVLDDGMLILLEYLRHIRPPGQAGVGDAFLKWVWQHQAVRDRCIRVPLTSREGVYKGEDFHEFPDDPSLAGFHADARKFVAVALASGADPDVLNAVDSDWWDFREALTRHGVRVRFLCPGLFG